MPRKPSVTARCWLFKTEPETYAFADLVAERRATWDGVKSPLALRHLAAAAVGDEVLVYHTGREKAVVGTARVVREAYPDPDADDPRRLVVDLEAGAALARPVSLSAMKANPKLAGFDLLRLPRLSVVPVPATVRAEIQRMIDARP